MSVRVRLPLVVLAATVLAGCAATAARQSDVSSVTVPGGTLEQRQRATGTAYRRLEQARYDSRLAEQDYLNAKAAYDRARSGLDAAKKAFDAAKAQEKAAEQDYERGLRSVDELYGGRNEPRKR